MKQAKIRCYRTHIENVFERNERVSARALIRSFREPKGDNDGDGWTEKDGGAKEIVGKSSEKRERLECNLYSL